MMLYFISIAMFSSQNSYVRYCWDHTRTSEKLDGALPKIAFGTAALSSVCVPGPVLIVILSPIAKVDMMLYFISIAMFSLQNSYVRYCWDHIRTSEEMDGTVPKIAFCLDYEFFDKVQILAT